MVFFKNYITREYVKSNPDKQFLFGDNLLGKGFGGQAKELRGEPNSFGIPTKKTPNTYFSSYFSDDEFEENKKAIDEAFAKLDYSKDIIIPEDGLGTGRAKLEEKAPKTFLYLQRKIQEIKQIGYLIG